MLAATPRSILCPHTGLAGMIAETIGYEVRWYFKVLFRFAGLSREGPVRGCPLTRSPAPSSTPACAAIVAVHSGLSTRMPPADRLPCPRASVNPRLFSPWLPSGMPLSVTRVSKIRSGAVSIFSFLPRFLKHAAIRRPPHVPLSVRCSAHSWGVTRPVITPFRVESRFAASFSPVVLLRSSRTPPMLKLVALRFCRSESFQVALLIFSDHRQEFPQTVESLRDPPSALCAVLPDAFVDNR